ncbi:hypothetical protein ACFE33_04515 [Falsihalocynthiibacter sp. SS001]|uniref:hypothetical protein n=1 Tax=Falsihalocynthiibacter sp. SS001 TaxID=3349698 RepID=UPI0036D2CEFF
MRYLSRLILLSSALLPTVAFGDIAMAINRSKAGTVDAMADVQCAQEVGQSLGTCTAVCARVEESAVVTVTFQNGFRRQLMFSDETFLRGDATMSGVGTDTDWRLVDGIYQIRVDDQRFEIPETLVLGE